MINYTIKKKLDLKHYTTFHIAGMVDVAFFPKNKEGIRDSLNSIKNDYKLPFFFLGKGSNVAIKNGRLKYATILTQDLKKITLDKENDEVIVEGGVSMSALGRCLLEKHHYKGLEWAYALPGSIGGGIFMNARAYGKELADIVKWVEIYDYEKNQFLTLQGNECQFGYKKSVFQEKSYFIYRVCLGIERVDGSQYQPLVETMISYREDRIKKGQFAYPSAGSCFRNNYAYGAPSGKIIESLNLKNLSQGDITISEFHANFFVNKGNGSFDDFTKLVTTVQSKVKEELGVKLEIEIQLLPLE